MGIGGALHRPDHGGGTRLLKRERGPDQAIQKRIQNEPAKKREKGRKNKSNTHADTIWGCFTAFRNRFTFAAASSHLVAAAVLLGFFGQLPNIDVVARRFNASPGAVDAADQLTHA